MKILIASDTYYPNVNGAAYFTYRLTKMLAKRGHQVYVMAPSPESKANIFTHDDVTVYGLPSIGVLIYPDFRISPVIIAKKSIRKFLKEIRPDIIHIQNHFMIGKAVLEVARPLNIPAVGTNHFMPENLVHYLRLPKFTEEKIKQFGWNQFLKVYNQLDFVTTPTKTAADLIINLGLNKEVIPLSNGIDLERFNPAIDGMSLKTHFNIPGQRMVLLYVGRLEKEKRVGVLIRALPEIIKNKIDVHLVIAGTGKLKPALEALSRELGLKDRVSFTGFVPDNDLPKLYRLADVFVIAGIAELQSIATMEAMASGLPVVAARAMALPELVEEGENGFLFTADDSRELANNVIKILSDGRLKAAMGEKSREMIKSHDINKIIEKYEQIYKKAIDLHVHKTVIDQFEAGRKSAVKTARLILSGLGIAALALAMMLAFNNFSLETVRNSFDNMAIKVQEKISTNQNIRQIKYDIESFRQVIKQNL